MAYALDAYTKLHNASSTTPAPVKALGAMSKPHVPQNNPPSDAPPADEPPPYTEIAEGGSVSVDEGVGVTDIRRWDVQTNRPSDASSTATAASAATASSARPAAPLPEIHRPPPGPPPSSASRPPSAASSTHRPPPGPPPNRHHAPSRPPDSKLRPPPGRPPSTHSSHSTHSNYSAHSSHSNHSSSSAHARPYSQNLPPQWPPTQQNPHLRYPPNYFCSKCHNTGIKVKKGTTCKDCYERFGVRSQAQYLPPGVMPVFPVAPRVVMPGDPSIGGALCGRCRGRGIIHDMFIFEDTCPVCHGVGRVF